MTMNARLTIALARPPWLVEGETLYIDKSLVCSRLKQYVPKQTMLHLCASLPFPKRWV